LAQPIGGVAIGADYSRVVVIGRCLGRHGLHSKNVGFSRVIVVLGDEPLVQHRLELLQFRYGILRAGRLVCGARLSWGLLWWSLLLIRWSMRLLQAADGARSRIDSHAEEGHPRSPARAARVFAGGLETPSGRLLHECVTAAPGKRVGLLDLAEQLTGVFIVFDCL